MLVRVTEERAQRSALLPRSMEGRALLGIRLMLAAFEAARAVGLGDVATRLLLRFCASALDDDPEPWARLSMEERCHALGRDEDEASVRAVERATGQITKAGLMVKVAGGHREGPATYAIKVRAERVPFGTESPANSAGKVRDERGKGTRSARAIGAIRSNEEGRAVARKTNQLPPATEHQPWHRTVALDGSCVQCMWRP